MALFFVFGVVGFAGLAGTVDFMAWTWIELEGAHNARDLGGLPATAGETRPGVLFRADALDQLTEADVDKLHATHGLAHVIDLRASTEREVRGRGRLGDTGVRYTEVEVIGPDDMQRRHEARRTAFEAGRLPDELMSDSYVELLDLGAWAFVEAFRQVIAPGGTPALVHCAAGKDRTGVLVALLLDVVGVERDVIIADYAATDERMPHILDRLGVVAATGPAAAGSVDVTHVPAFVLGATAETMELFLADLDRQWGGAAGFLTAHGVVETELERWRQLFVASDVA